MLPDTEQFNVTFVKAVEEYPALYDTTSKEYSNRNEQDKSWKTLAQNFESTGKRTMYLYFIFVSKQLNAYFKVNYGLFCQGREFSGLEK